MAGSHYRTELGTMQAAVGHVHDVNGNIQGQLTSLMARLEPLMSTWQGDASVAFHGTKERWNANAVKLNNALRGIAESLQVNRANYETSEQTNQTGFNQINSVL